MRKLVLLVISAILFVSFPTMAKDEKAVKEEIKNAPAPKVAVAPKTKFIIDEETLLMLFDEPEEHFVKARNSMSRKDVKETSFELKKAVAFMKLEALRSSEENEKGIRASISEIEKLLSEMEKSTIGITIRKLAESMKQDALKTSGDSAKALQVSGAELVKLADQMEETAPQLSSPETLDPIVARAHFALIKHHLSKSKELWVRKESKRSGSDLEATCEHFARAYQWLNKDADSATKTTFKDARSFSIKLNQGLVITNDDYMKVSDLLTKEFERVSKLIDLAKK